MATFTVNWGDGSGDKIYLTCPASSGDQTVQVSSDANRGAARSKVVQFTAGNISRSLTVNQEAGATQEYTARLIPSAYTASSSSYVTVSNANNMYNDTDHTANYASIRGRGGRSSNSTYYCFIRGFNFDAVPSGATVKSFRVLIRCYRNNNQNTGSSYRMRLASQANNNNVISNTTASTDIGTSALVIQIPTGLLTWDTLKGYGANFSIEIRLRNTSTSSSQYPYVYVYGAEIEVTYEL